MLRAGGTINLRYMQQLGLPSGIAVKASAIRLILRYFYQYGPLACAMAPFVGAGLYLVVHLF
jgi:hypothetical protein